MAISLSSDLLQALASMVSAKKCDELESNVPKRFERSYQARSVNSKGQMHHKLPS